jgi:hypothetical protein
MSIAMSAIFPFYSFNFLDFQSFVEYEDALTSSEETEGDDKEREYDRCPGCFGGGCSYCLMLER